jgi:predicted nucleic acid-binding protein
MITGLDANIVCYALDDAYAEHQVLKNLLLELTSENKMALNPTTIHEAYHTLVRSQKWLPEEAADALLTLINMPNIEFYTQTRKISTIALNIAVQYRLGGRDSLVVANFLANNTSRMYTHDKELLKLQVITYKNTTLTIKDPTNNHT